MDKSLKRLIKMFPPPSNPRFGCVDWERLESQIKLKYPSTFKEYVYAYGGSVWFDNVTPYYSESQTDKEAKAFVKRVSKSLSHLQDNMYAADFKKMDLPLYPSMGGLFPFMADYSSHLFCWRTDGSDPDRWLAVCWLCGEVVDLGKTTISQLICDWIDGDSTMSRIWGDSNEYKSQGRLRLTEV